MAEEERNEGARLRKENDTFILEIQRMREEGRDVGNDVGVIVRRRDEEMKGDEVRRMKR